MGTGSRSSSEATCPESTLEDWEASGALRDRKIGFGWVAALEAWRQAGCGEDASDTWLSMALGLEQAFLEDFGPLLREEGARTADRLGGRAGSSPASGALPLAH